jgi:zinc-binding alcohol dehydrogenase/oxidoreductase
MNAIVLHEPGGLGALRFEKVADPAPGPGEVIIGVRAAALNHRDLFICKGQYAGLRFPIILGSDGTGDVVELGAGVTNLRRGDRVVITPASTGATIRGLKARAGGSSASPKTALLPSW